MKGFIRVNVAFLSGMIYMIILPSACIDLFDRSILNNILLASLISIPSYVVYYLGEIKTNG